MRDGKTGEVELTEVDLACLRSLRGRDWITEQDWTREELVAVLDLAAAVKRLWGEGVPTPLLDRKHLALLFEEPSTRTRVSFEVGMADLGGTSLYLKPGEIHLGGRESVGDTARVLSRFVQGIMARLLRHEVLEELAAHASVPVINGLTDRWHPVQTLSDAFTIREVAGTLRGIRVAFLGDATNVCASLATMCPKLGVDFVAANPPGYELPAEVQAVARRNAEEAGSRVEFLHDPVAAVRDADFVYTDLWWWVGQEAEAEARKRAMAPYQVNAGLMARAPRHARFMHCLPAARGLEVTDDVMDGDHSIVFQQAENRMHLEKGLLVALLGVDRIPAGVDRRVRELGEALGGRPEEGGRGQ
ncbi:MAG: ornithine carbamoyltransferase [Bacillota bacterium]|nr:ornithine carbamoyltransferase [Bacillota bacterium]